MRERIYILGRRNKAEGMAVIYQLLDIGMLEGVVVSKRLFGLDREGAEVCIEGAVVWTMTDRPVGPEVVVWMMLETTVGLEVVGVWMLPVGEQVVMPE